MIFIKCFKNSILLSGPMYVIELQDAPLTYFLCKLMLVKCFWKTRFFIFNKSIIIKTGLSAVYHTKNVKILVGTRNNLIVIIIAKMMRSSPHVPKRSGGPGLWVHCYFYSLIKYCLLTIAYCIQCSVCTIPGN